jgi:hypothetical protein
MALNARDCATEPDCGYLELPAAFHAPGKSSFGRGAAGSRPLVLGSLSAREVLSGTANGSMQRNSFVDKTEVKQQQIDAAAFMQPRKHRLGVIILKEMGRAENCWNGLERRRRLGQV